MDVKTLAIVLVLIAAFLGAVGQYYMKLGSSSISLEIMSWVVNYRLYIAFSLYAVSTVLYLFALKNGSVSVLYPIMATSFIWTALMAVKYLDETMTYAKWAGMALIILGVFLIAK